MAVDYIPYIRKKVGHDEILSVSLAALIVNHEGKILLEKRRDNGLYSLPGGSIDLYETVLEGVKREVREETGLLLQNPILFQIRSGEKSIFRYPNGDVTHYVDLTFFEEITAEDDDIKPEDQESLFLHFFSKEELPHQEEFLPNSYATVQKYLQGDFHVTID